MSIAPIYIIAIVAVVLILLCAAIIWISRHQPNPRVEAAKGNLKGRVAGRKRDLEKPTSSKKGGLKGWLIVISLVFLLAGLFIGAYYQRQQVQDLKLQRKKAMEKTVKEANKMLEKMKKQLFDNSKIDPKLKEKIEKEYKKKIEEYYKKSK